MNRLDVIRPRELGVAAIPRMSPETRTTLAIAACSTAYWLVFLPLDRSTTLLQQMALATTTWTFLVLALRKVPPTQRVQVLTMIFVATCGECIGSLLWGAYRYRLGSIPLYVPAGHGIFFLNAVRISELHWLQAHRRIVVGAVLVAAIVLVTRGMLMLPARDLLGFATGVLLLRFLFRGSRPVFYAVSYAMTMTLEFYGTSLGLWTWTPILPFVGISVANPPAGIGAGYCTMDAIARRFAPRNERAFAALVRWWRGRTSATASSPRRWAGGTDPGLRALGDSAPVD